MNKPNKPVETMTQGAEPFDCEFLSNDGIYRLLAFDDGNDYRLQLMVRQTDEIVWRGACEGYKLWTVAAHLDELIASLPPSPPAPEVKEEAGEMPWMKTFRVLHDIHAALNPTLNPDPAKAADEARNLVWSLINEVDLYASKEITIATAPIPEPSEPQTEDEPSREGPYPNDGDVQDERTYWFSEQAFNPTFTRVAQKGVVLLIRKLYTDAAGRRSR